MKKGGLGRGLSALIPGAPEGAAPSAPATTGGPLQVPVDQITPNKRQPRTVFDDDALAALAHSIKEVGILQPVVVRRTASGYELIAGERRLRAAKRAGLKTIPVILRESDDSDSLREALIENIHRQNLNPIELAESFRELLDELGLKQETLATRLSVSRSHIANTIRLLALPAEVQAMLSEGRIQAGHGRALLALGDAEAQKRIALRVVAEGLSVREVEDVVRGIIDRPANPPVKAPSGKGGAPAAGGPLTEIEEIIGAHLSTRVSVQMSDKRGRIVIEFGSPEDLERIVDEITGRGGRR